MIGLNFKALHSELLTELSGRFPSRNKYFVISKVRVERHFFVIFGKFGIAYSLRHCNKLSTSQKFRTQSDKKRKSSRDTLKGTEHVKNIIILDCLALPTFVYGANSNIHIVLF